jgi:2'-5' RNA ligase
MPASTADRRPLRLFFAAWPDAPARHALAALAQRVASECAGRATREQSLHVTLAFLGAVQRDRLADAGAAGSAAAAAASPFALTLDRLGGVRREGVAWLAAERPPEMMSRLHDALAQSLAQRGFAVEHRALRPHVTLARRCARLPDHRLPASVSWTVDRLALVASAPERGGSRYESIATWPLAG